MRIRWTTQNEQFDDNGLLEGETAWLAELKLLKSMGCPDTEQAKFVSFEIVGRDESITTAEVTDAMARWLFNETDAEEVEEAA
jgi:hypothetical protein